ncbi:hypothetical protein DFH08DRAFT_640534, partial [Mycena albidolilacea]
CPACGRSSKTSGATKSHLSQAVSCRWYRKGKNPTGQRRTMRTPSPEPEILDDIPEVLPDRAVEEVMQEWEDNVFRYLPADP